MAILQALLALLSRSAGKILTSIFGWAVRALFGRSSPREAAFLSGLVGAAAAWPILLIGLAAPKIAALMLAFVPIPHWVPSWSVRLVWLVLALLVPFAVGIAVSSKAPPDRMRGPLWKRVLSGLPITIGLALAFLIMFVTVPFMRLGAWLFGKASADIPLITDAKSYHQVADLVVGVLNDHGFNLRPGKPGWWVAAPTRVLKFFGGDAFGSYVPKSMEYQRSPNLVVSFYPSGILLQGKPAKLTWAHGLICEVTARSAGLQTTAPKAQDLEKQIKRLWDFADNAARDPAESQRSRNRLDDIARALGAADIDFDDWQVIYRQLLQVDRALSGREQLLQSRSVAATAYIHKPERVASGETSTINKGTGKGTQQARPEANMRRDDHASLSVAPSATTASPQELSTTDLVKQIGADVSHLARTQIGLAMTELRADLKTEATAVAGLGVAAFSGFATVIMLLVTAALALARWMPPWSAGLLVSGFTLAVAAIVAVVSWRKRLRSPLARTRRTMNNTLQWSKENLA